MTSWREPPQADETEPQVEVPVQEPLPERPQRQPRPRRERSQADPALDPRLAQLESRSRRPSRKGDVSLIVIAVAAFVFGVAMHGWVASSLLGSDDSTSPVAVEATVTPGAGASTGAGGAASPTVAPQATATPLPDRTSCDEIRGTQYRSVTEREFFLANCTS